ncbi:kynurenine/alpha-aminoadipate aminotransferase, mitochondrial isoform X4 [Procambarus clarkii]|uniref:kynurenine/alpha-aminoadipate aminotransferase, mitochondrial isoform X4 n=1 Tax=Procambarus clarkii TaxID=6728 RepID=UPI001E6746CA|nr:kynurenine/alpha-aminoadipate aminotransferase, mitochondrial-like isoform X4 [Procambarus clarkii]
MRWRFRDIKQMAPDLTADPETQRGTTVICHTLPSAVNTKMNYSRFLTRTSKNRQPSLIRELTNLLSTASPELVFMAGGLPNPQMFPFQAASVTLTDGRTLSIHPKLMTDCLQYGATPGYPALVKQLKELTQKIHAPPCWENSDLIVTAGSQDGLCKALEMMVNTGDYVVTQEPCYTGTLAILNPYKPRYLAVQGDHEGMKPEALKAVLSCWQPQDVRDAEENVPKDFPPSFLSMDTDGRVLRFDSFSKILSSGLRIGYVTGPKPLIERIVLHEQVSVLHAPAMSQVLVSELLKLWGMEDFFKHTHKVQDFYHKQRDAMLKAADTHLKGLCEWSVPTGGMFLWLKVSGVYDTWDMILERALTKNVILVPGKAFMCDTSAPSQYMRAAFSVVTPEAMDKGLSSLAELIREEIARQE